MAFLFDLFSLAASGSAVMYYLRYTGAHHQSDSLISLGLGVAAVFFAFQGFFRRMEKVGRDLVNRGVMDEQTKRKRNSALAILVVLSLFGAGNCLYYFRFLRSVTIFRIVIGIFVVAVAIPVNIKGLDLSEEGNETCRRAAFVGLWEYATIYRTLLTVATESHDFFEEFVWSEEALLYNPLTWPHLMKFMLVIGTVSLIISVVSLISNRSYEEIWAILTMAVDVFIVFTLYNIILLGGDVLHFIALLIFGAVTGFFMLLGCLFIPFAMIFPNTAGVIASSSSSQSSTVGAQSVGNDSSDDPINDMPILITDDLGRSWIRDYAIPDAVYYRLADGEQSVVDDKDALRDSDAVIISKSQIKSNSASIYTRTFYW